jgi:hypothetical protein
MWRTLSSAPSSPGAAFHSSASPAAGQLLPVFNLLLLITTVTIFRLVFEDLLADSVLALLRIFDSIDPKISFFFFVATSDFLDADPQSTDPI